MKVNMIMCLAASTAVIAKNDESQLRDGDTTIVDTRSRLWKPPHSGEGGKHRRRRYGQRRRRSGPDYDSGSDDFFDANYIRKFDNFKKKFFKFAYTGFDDKVADNDERGFVEEFRVLAATFCFNLLNFERNGNPIVFDPEVDPEVIPDYFRDSEVCFNELGYQGVFLPLGENDDIPSFRRYSGRFGNHRRSGQHDDSGSDDARIIDDDFINRFNDFKKKVFKFAYTGFDDALKYQDRFDVNDNQLKPLAIKLCVNLAFYEPNGDDKAMTDALSTECDSCLERLGYIDRCSGDEVREP